MAEATPTMVFVYGTLKRGFPNHSLLVASATPFVGAASTAGPASLIIGPYSVPFLLPTPASASSGRVVSGELYAPSPAALAELDALEASASPPHQTRCSLSTGLGTHIGVYERRPITVVVDGSGEVVQAEAYFAHPSYAEALWRRCGGEEAEIGEYTVDHAGEYVPKSERLADAAGLIDAIHRFVATATDNRRRAHGLLP
ncbi:AIG2-like (avirulence induced gene) family protein [Zea mays]|uniref:Gamma-glutamylcyclotransferase family protein n=1 Tax=Zea mays TaxID=4577 RepID=A0A1D6IBA5_MAIZE|nr:AIG2-like (avirulence induced gene) family protein [Zea mays]